MVVDLNWDNIYISSPRNHTQTRTVSKQIETGKDTTGRTTYKTVTATLYITKQDLNARAEMDCRFTDLSDSDNDRWNRIPVYLDLSTEHATYRGDSRALSDYDWALVNNRQQTYMRESDIMDALYAQVYPQLRSRIESVTRW
jgi:hypothetical protein